MPEDRSQDVLVFVHPGAAARGPMDQIRTQCDLVRAWTGALIVLDDGGPFPDAALTGRLRAAFVDAGLHPPEGAGPRWRIASPAGGLATAVVRLLELAGTRRDFLITGAGTAIAETARLLARAGARARVHPSAVTYDEGAV